MVGFFSILLRVDLRVLGVGVLFRILIDRVFLRTLSDTLREKSPKTEFFLVCIFPQLDRIQRDTECLFVFSPNAGKYGPENTRYLDTFHAVIVSLLRSSVIGSFPGSLVIMASIRP